MDSHPINGNADTPPRMLTVAEAADILGIGTTLAYELIHTGELEARNLRPDGPRAVWRIPAQVIDDLAEARQ